jgi:hypothetical protein
MTLPNEDTGLLPYWSGIDRALEPNKFACVLAIMSCVVVGYWMIRRTKGSLDTSEIERRLDQLRYIVEHWDELVVHGSTRSRYWLNIPHDGKSFGVINEKEETDEIRAEETATETD